MRNFEQVSQLFGVIEPEHVSHGSNHEHLEGDRIVFSKLLIKERKKPEKFWLPHGRPSDDRAFAFSSRVFPKASQIKALYKLWHYQAWWRGTPRRMPRSTTADTATSITSHRRVCPRPS